MKIRHITPKYYGYKSSYWTNITECEDCNTRTLYEDRHPAKPCPDCGGKLTVRIGKYTGTRKISKFLDLFYDVISSGWQSDGVWIVKNEDK